MSIGTIARSGGMLAAGGAAAVAGYAGMHGMFRTVVDGDPDPPVRTIAAGVAGLALFAGGSVGAAVGADALGRALGAAGRGGMVGATIAGAALALGGAALAIAPPGEDVAWKRAGGVVSGAAGLLLAAGARSGAAIAAARPFATSGAGIRLSSDPHEAVNQLASLGALAKYVLRGGG